MKINRKNTSPRYWNKILSDAGLGVKLKPLPKKQRGRKRAAVNRMGTNVAIPAQ